MGIGGGLYWVPLFNALLGFSIKGAAALSQCCVACGTLGALSYNIMLRHPLYPKAPLIDYPLATVLMPSLVLGVSVGVLLNFIVPSLILSIVLFIILLIIGARTLQNAIRQRRREKEAAAAAAGAAKLLEEEEETASTATGEQKQQNVTKQLRRQQSLKVLKEVSGIMQKPIIPWRFVFELLLTGAVFLGFQIGKTHYKRCDWEYGLLFGVQAGVMMAVSMGSLLLRAKAQEEAEKEQEQKEENGVEAKGIENSSSSKICSNVDVHVDITTTEDASNSVGMGGRGWRRATKRALHAVVVVIPVPLLLLVSWNQAMHPKKQQTTPIKTPTATQENYNTRNGVPAFYLLFG